MFTSSPRRYVLKKKNCNQGNPHLLRHRSLPNPSFLYLWERPLSSVAANRECALLPHTPTDVMHTLAPDCLVEEAGGAAERFAFFSAEAFVEARSTRPHARD